MPEVYTGKVLIPGDQIDAYLTALKEAEEARAPFRCSLDDLNAAFAASLDKKYSRRTVLKHTSIIDLFIIFLLRLYRCGAFGRRDAQHGQQPLSPLVPAQGARPPGPRRDPCRVQEVLRVPRPGAGHSQPQGVGGATVMVAPVTVAL